MDDLISVSIILAILLMSCQGMQQTAQNGAIEETIRRVTPKDVKSHTNKIIINEHQFQINRSEETNSALYFETDWKTLRPTEEEETLGISDVRMRVKIRTQKIRRGMDEFEVHNLKYTAELQGITEESNGDWDNIEITPEREDFMTDIYKDFETEFRSGVMAY